MRRKQGSLTVEAVISFTVFLGVMFLLLTLVKLVLVMMILNNATVETCKIFATEAYPIAILNEMQSELESNYDKKVSELKTEVENLRPESIANNLTHGVGNNMITQLLGQSGTAANDAISAVTSLIDRAADFGKSGFYHLKGQAVHTLCSSFVKDYLENSGLRFDLDKVVLRTVKLPQTDMEFETVHQGALKLSDTGNLEAKPASSASGTDGEFNADDVVICLEYPYEIALPLIPSVTVTLRSVSVEHGWLHGTSQGPKRTEGIDISNLLKADYVFIGAKHTGKRYHKEECFTIKRGYERITRADAKAQGLTPCKVCSPG